MTDLISQIHLGGACCMEAKTLQEKSEKILTLLQVAKDINAIYFESKEKKAEIIQKAVVKLEEELKDY